MVMTRYLQTPTGPRRSTTLLGLCLVSSRYCSTWVVGEVWTGGLCIRRGGTKVWNPVTGKNRLRQGSGTSFPKVLWSKVELV